MIIHITLFKSFQYVPFWNTGGKIFYKIPSPHGKQVNLFILYIPFLLK